MKKALSLVLLTGFMLVSFVPAFAAEKTNLPYVEGLGYEVEVFEEDYTLPRLFS